MVGRAACMSGPAMVTMTKRIEERWRDKHTKSTTRQSIFSDVEKRGIEKTKNNVQG